MNPLQQSLIIFLGLGALIPRNTDSVAAKFCSPTIRSGVFRMNTNATVTHEQVGTTQFGDPEVLVTVEAPHPKAGFQLLLRSTASMDHMSKLKAETGKTSYLVYPWPGPGRSTDWHGATRDQTLEGALVQIAGYVDWLWEREQVREGIEIGAVTEHLGRFWRGLWEESAIDYKAEWRAVLEEVARINLLMAALTPEDDR